MKPMKFFAVLAFAGGALFAACKFKQHAEARIKGEGGEVILKVEVTAGAEFKTKGKFTERDCPPPTSGQTPPLVTVASCDVLANITRKENGKEVTRSERHTLEYKVACVPGTEWEVDCSDPVILQIPVDWHINRASFASKSRRGDLIAETATPAADALGTPYRAEPGHKVLVLGFPYGTPYDDYEIEIYFGSSRPGPARIKAIFAGAARITNPVTGLVTAYYPPASPAVSDFRLVQDPFYMADVISVPILSWQLSAGDIASLNLPRSAERSYFVLAAPGADLAAVDTRKLFLRKE